MKNCYKLFDGWEASFDATWSDFGLKVGDGLGEYLTFCVIRKPHTKLIFSGCAVYNWGDVPDDKKGKKVAFGRALDAMLPSYHECSTAYQSRKIHDIRKMFWDALLTQL